MPNWQDPTDYNFIEKSRPELIAWEFLRRNPNYQTDYKWFINLWNQLESQYGKPPNRDFNSWKKDPRAYRSEHEIYNVKLNPDNNNDDNLLIECWMGTKWGFYKFPLDPLMDNPKIGVELTWRDSPIDIKLYNESSIQDLMQENFENKTAIIFDLQKDLNQQLENAKQKLIIAKKKNSCLANNIKVWILYLRILDAVNDDASENDIQKSFNLTLEEFASTKSNATNLMRDHYREIIAYL